MKKVVFIIGSVHYSNDVLSRCLEKYADSTCYHFFSKSEMMLYLDLDPDMIIAEGEIFEFSRSDLAIMKAKLTVQPLVYGVYNEEIRIQRIKTNGLKSVKKLKYDNLLSSLSSLIKYGEGTRKASALLMY